MKYCFIVASMIGGGTERVISILANSFVKTGNEVEILLTANNIVDYELNENIRVTLLTENTNGSLKKRIERIGALRREYKANPDAIFYSFGTETNLFAILASLGLKTQLVISERNDPNQCHFKCLRNIIYFFGKTFVFQTKDAALCFSKRIQKRGVVIPNPIKKELPNPYLGERQKLIVTVGRLEPQKNQKLLLEAFAKFHRNFPDYKLRIYGQGNLKSELVNKAKELKIYDLVEFMGFSEKVLAEIQDVSMYVLSSDYEGMPNSLMEAMGIGLPVVATNCPIGGPADLIQNGENGQLVTIGNVEQLKNAMIKYASDEKFSLKCSKNAVRVRVKYRQEDIVKQWMSLKRKI